VAVVATIATLLTWTVGPAAFGQDDEFVLGSGRSEARVVRFGPSAGNLSLAPMVGVALADYLNQLGRSESRAFEFSALNDSVPDGFKEEFPSARSESREENSDEGQTIRKAGTPEESPVSVGSMRQAARSNDTPYGESVFVLGDFELVPGVVEISGARANSRVGIIDGAIREARGITTIGRMELGGGAVVLRGMRWEAVQRTGAEEAASGSFTVEGITIGGQDLPVPTDAEQLASAFEQINAAIKPTGLQISVPTGTAQGGVVRISPLQLRIADSEVGNAVLGPVIGGAQPVREPITAGLIESFPQSASAILLADVTLGVFSGASNFDVELGGATAFTEGETFDDPFGDFELGGFDDFGPVTDVGGAGGDTTGAGVGGTAGTPGTPGTPDQVIEQEAPATAGNGGGGQAVATPISETTDTGPGMAILVGLVGLFAAVGMAAADWHRIRNAQRMIPA
jgi:hypothetical protein